MMPDDNKPIKWSRFPILEGISSPKTRALLAIGLGCDVNTKGVRGVSKAILKGWLDSNKQDYDNLMDFFVQQATCDNTKTKQLVHTNEINTRDRAQLVTAINTLVYAFLYEPCNYIQSSEQSHIGSTMPIYIHTEKPTSLHYYLKDFAKGIWTFWFGKKVLTWRPV